MQPHDVSSFKFGRCTLSTDSAFTVYRPNHQVQSDADALEDARREAMGLPPKPRYRRDRVEVATDDQVYERFKKR